MIKVEIDGKTYTCQNVGTAFGSSLGDLVMFYGLPDGDGPREIKIEDPKTFKVEWNEPGQKAVSGSD